jgi:hypothetical protein
MRIYLFVFAAASIWLGSSCSSIPQGAYTDLGPPPAPDYSRQEYWAALPDRKDEADKSIPGFPESQANAEVDVFFLHPTIYTGEKGDILWNGPVDDPGLNRRVDESTIRYQASVFNNVGKVYAPRYRQAHIKAYSTNQKADAKLAFELAYSDIRKAFLYFLENYNHGRPIIIAGHSQGAQHGISLLKEFFDGQPLSERLVAAYIVGMPVSPSGYTVLQPCKSAEQTGCYCSWRTFRKGYYPHKFVAGNSFLSTNPLNWSIDGTYAPRTLHKGAVLRDFERIYPRVSDAVNHEGMLWISRPRFPWSFLYMKKNYHVGDFNLFYVNVRENVKLRVEAFERSQQ